MPLEITIRRDDGLPMVQDVVKLGIEMAFPGVRFYREPSGVEKLSALEKMEVDLPDALRRHFQEVPSTECGDFEGDGFSVRFFLGSGHATVTVEAELRGDTERAYPFLRRLAQGNRWVVAENGRRI